MPITSSYVPCLFYIETYSIIKERKLIILLMIDESTEKLTGKFFRSVYPLMKEMKRIQQDTALY